MTSPEKYLHTTHRTVAWFHKAFLREELELAAPFQRNPVWTDHQKAYLIDTILLGLPIPELYMQERVDEDGKEVQTVVDGQQRVRACLDFLAGKYSLEGTDTAPITSRWRGLGFDQLGTEERRQLFGYKFVVRVLPQMPESEVRAIFARLNRNVVALNDQELRNATYWGEFISAIQSMADDDSFWAECGVFSANDHRRMLDHEFISELAIAHLHGVQNKKDKLDDYYHRYEEQFDGRSSLIATFRKTTGELAAILPSINLTRWRKKSDFYTLFLVLAERADSFPLSSENRTSIQSRLYEMAGLVDKLLKLEETEWTETDPHVLAYARAVSRAASDKANRATRHAAVIAFAFSTVQLSL